jgi:hypothetical protein
MQMNKYEAGKQIGARDFAAKHVAHPAITLADDREWARGYREGWNEARATIGGYPWGVQKVRA